MYKCGRYNTQIPNEEYGQYSFKEREACNIICISAKQVWGNSGSTRYINVRKSYQKCPQTPSLRVGRANELNIRFWFLLNNIKYGNLECCNF
jgi:hypothetical protein